MSESSQNNTKNGKLLPCPFCGGKAMRAKSNSGTWSVICQNCDTGIFRPRYKTNEWNAFDTEAEAVDAWNMRAESGSEINGDTSDGYHTFDELYRHRAVLFSVIVRDHRELAWKARKHHDGTMYDGMFIVGIETPKGQATYHYDIDPYWEMFDCEELEFAPEWDGHTPDEAIARISSLNTCVERLSDRAGTIRLNAALACSSAPNVELTST